MFRRIRTDSSAWKSKIKNNIAIVLITRTPILGIIYLKIQSFQWKQSCWPSQILHIAVSQLHIPKPPGDVDSTAGRAYIVYLDGRPRYNPKSCISPSSLNILAYEDVDVTWVRGRDWFEHLITHSYHEPITHCQASFFLRVKKTIYEELNKWCKLGYKRKLKRNLKTDSL